MALRELKVCLLGVSAGGPAAGPRRTRRAGGARRAHGPFAPSPISSRGAAHLPLDPRAVVPPPRHTPLKPSWQEGPSLCALPGAPGLFPPP